MDPFFYLGAKYLFIASIILAVYYFFMNPDTRKKFVWLSVLSLLLSYLLGVIGRGLYYNPRPFVVEDFKPLINHLPDNGFPSDHTLLVATIAALVTVFDKKLGAVLWGLVIIVGASRVYAGVHHMLDIVASVIISILSVAVVYFVIKRYGHSK